MSTRALKVKFDLKRSRNSYSLTSAFGVELLASTFIFRKIVTNKMPTMANTARAEARERLNRVTIRASTVRVHWNGLSCFNGSQMVSAGYSEVYRSMACSFVVGGFGWLKHLIQVGFCFRVPHISSYIICPWFGFAKKRAKLKQRLRRQGLNSFR